MSHTSFWQRLTAGQKRHKATTFMLFLQFYSNKDDDGETENTIVLTNNYFSILGILSDLH